MSEYVIQGEVQKQIDHWVGKYPDKRSAIVAALMIAQKDLGGHLTDSAMKAVARYLGQPDINVYELATFYDMFELNPIGCHKIAVCTNLACKLRGADKLVGHLKDKLGIGLGETTADGKFTLREVECLAACANAPVCQVDDEQYVEDLTPEKMDRLLADLAKEGV